MYFSLTPPRHADHDHAMASLNASGFLRIEQYGGGTLNLVGQPGRVLILHFFDPRSPNAMEQAHAARYTASVAGDPSVAVLFVANAPAWDGLPEWAETVGVPLANLYLDKDGKTSHLLGVRRWPETLVYAADGTLAYQARGSAGWSSPAFLSEVDRARAGVEEMP